MSTSTVQLLTVMEAADALGLSRSKVYELLAAGEMPSVRIGRTRRIAVNDLKWFIDRHRVDADAPSFPLDDPPLHASVLGQGQDQRR